MERVKVSITWTEGSEHSDYTITNERFDEDGQRVGCFVWDGEAVGEHFRTFAGLLDLGAFPTLF